MTFPVKNDFPNNNLQVSNVKLHPNPLGSYMQVLLCSIIISPINEIHLTKR